MDVGEEWAQIKETGVCSGTKVRETCDIEVSGFGAEVKMALEN
jgi:hypothetical protein